MKKPSDSRRGERGVESFPQFTKHFVKVPHGVEKTTDTDTDVNSSTLRPSAVMMK